MVGPSDIPCFKGKIVKKNSDSTVDPLFSAFNHMFSYKNCIELVEIEVEKLDKMCREVAAEVDSGKEIYDPVLKWQKEAEEIQQSAKDFCEKYKNRQSWRCIQQRLSILNPIARIRLGREAVHMAKQITELIDVRKNNQIMNFQSRKDAFEKVWDALVSKNEDNPAIIVIYGMAGVGKTQMVEQILTEAECKGIFDKVIRADVGRAAVYSNRLDLISLQNQIAGYLNLQFESQDDEEDRACQLSKSLDDEGKLLIVLDDIWNDISLDAIGIRLSSPDCKILLISRVLEYVCGRYNRCTHLVMLKPLTVDESWDLFINTVGTDKIVSLQDESLAKQVCNKCGGLPLIIQSVGKTLKSKPYSLWMEAFSPLEVGKFESVPGIGPDIYSCLKLSFDYLLPKKAKAFVLSCSLFPEDADIPIRYLILLETTRSEVLKGVDILVSSLMLVKDKDDQHVKLHPIFRGLVRSIAVRDYAFLFVRRGSLLPDRADYGKRTVLHLDLDNNDFHFPDNLVCPDLHTLSIRSVMSTLEQQLVLQEWDLAGMFGKLSSLVLTNCFCKQHYSLAPLSYLQSILLDHCDLFETDVGFFPEHLKTLCLWDCHLPEKLHLPDLKYLLKLEILGGICEVIFVPNTLSRLSSLKELHIANSFLILDDEGILVPILDEFSKMTSLTSLDICCSQFLQASQETNIFNNLREYNICVGSPRDSKLYPGALSTRLIELSGYKLEAFEVLVGRAEEVTLRNTDLRLSSIWNSSRQEFVCWRYLYIEECDCMEYVANLSQDEIPQYVTPQSFSQITILEIKRCSAIKYLFCNNAAYFFVELQQLCITDCPLMEAIIMNEGTSDGDTITFYKLKSLKLCNMPRLTSFYKYMHPSSTSITYNLIQPLFDEWVYFPSLEVLELSSLENTSDIWSNHDLSSYTSKSFGELKSLYITNCNRLEIVIPNAMLHRLQNLELLHIIECSSLISEVGTNDDNTEICPLVALSQMHLEKLPFLANTGLNSRDHSGAINLYPNLHSLYIKDCSRLNNVFQPSTARVLVRLKEMQVSNCEMMREIIGAGEEEEEITNGIMFPEMTILELSLLPNLTSFWCSPSTEAKTYKTGTIILHPNLHSLHIRDCSSLANVLRPCTARVLVHLKEMCVSNCEMMREIIGAGEEEEEITENITFPELTLLQLSLLPNLTSFWCSNSGEANTNKVAFPNLVDFELSGRELNLEAIEFGRDDSTCQLTSLSISLSCDKELQIPNTWKPRLYKLETLKLRHCWLQELKSQLFQSLKVLRVLEYGCSFIFTFSVLKNLQQLQELEISKCALLEEIVGDEDSDMYYYMDFQLKSLILRDLPNLKILIHSVCCGMPALEEVCVINCGLSTLFTCSFFKGLQKLKILEVSNCGLLEGIVQDSRDNETSYTDDTKITLFELVYVTLENLPNLKSFAHSAKYEWQMTALVEVQVDNCGLSTLFTSNVFKGLQNLRKIQVSNCRVLEGIVDDTTNDLTFSTNERNIKLSGLSQIFLKNLPNLGSFSPSARYYFEMPVLYTLHLVGCPRLEKFTSLKTTTGLVSVYTEGKCWEEVQDLNEYIRQKRKGGSNSKDTAGEWSSSNKKLYNEAVRVEELDLYLT